MYRMIKCSELGTYKNVKYFIEDKPNNRYYFMKKNGEPEYAEDEESIKIKIDNYVEASKRISNRKAVTAKTELSEGFSDALDELEDDVSYALSSIEALARRNESAARDIVNKFSQIVNSVISDIAEEIS